MKFYKLPEKCLDLGNFCIEIQKFPKSRHFSGSFHGNEQDINCTKIHVVINVDSKNVAKERKFIDKCRSNSRAAEVGICCSNECLRENTNLYKINAVFVFRVYAERPKVISWY